MDVSRTRLLVGNHGLDRLKEARVAVIGLGGVGAYAAEALARAGVGHLLLVDHDKVEPSNANRQIIALETTIGMYKTEAARERVGAINKDASVDILPVFVTQENLNSIFDWKPHFVIDAIDTLESKVYLLACCKELGIRHVSCMGAAKRLSPFGIKVADISTTRNCPLARTVRKQLKKMGITKGIRCVYSDEAALRQSHAEEYSMEKGVPGRYKKPQGSISYLCGIIGLTAAGIVIQDILSG